MNILSDLANNEFDIINICNYILNCVNGTKIAFVLLVNDNIKTLYSSTNENINTITKLYNNNLTLYVRGKIVSIISVQDGDNLESNKIINDLRYQLTIGSSMILSSYENDHIIDYIKEDWGRRLLSVRSHLENEDYKQDILNIVQGLDGMKYLFKTNRLGNVGFHSLSNLIHEIVKLFPDDKFKKFDNKIGDKIFRFDKEMVTEAILFIITSIGNQIELSVSEILSIKQYSIIEIKIIPINGLMELNSLIVNKIISKLNGDFTIDDKKIGIIKIRMYSV